MAVFPGMDIKAGGIAGSPVLSVVIPVGQTRWERPSWLDTALHSGLLPIDAEVIVVQDGNAANSITRSTPGKASPFWLREISLASPKGVGHARNVGMSYARGRTLTFVDSDDEVSLMGLWRATRYLLGSGADVTVAGFRRRAASGREVDIPISPTGPQNQLSSYLTDNAGVWRFIFRTDYLFEFGIRFPEMSFAEDLLFLLRLADTSPLAVPSEASWYTYKVGFVPQLTSRAVSADEVDAALRLLLGLARATTSKRIRALAQRWMARIVIRGAADQRGKGGSLTLLGESISTAFSSSPSSGIAFLRELTAWSYYYLARRSIDGGNTKA